MLGATQAADRIEIFPMREKSNEYFIRMRRACEWWCVVSVSPRLSLSLLFSLGNEYERVKEKEKKN